MVLPYGKNCLFSCSVLSFCLIGAAFDFLFLFCVFLLFSCHIILKYSSQPSLRSMNLTAYMGSSSHTRLAKIMVLQ